MKDLLEENDRLKREVEHLTLILQGVYDGLARSAEFWRNCYFEIPRDSLGTIPKTSYGGC
jgi:hypothetical protein